jgi:hypothetical protein
MKLVTTATSRRAQDRRLRELVALVGESVVLVLLEAVTQNSERPLMDLPDEWRDRAIAGFRQINHRAILARVELVIDSLRTCHVRAGWRLDEEGAERTLRYFRHCADGGEDDNHEYTAASEFLRRNGQSLDWVLLGDLRVMICRAAANARLDEDGGIVAVSH